ncbi:MAG: hypothetical protein ABI548_11890 [Polyangiaceae bacterium]
MTTAEMILKAAAQQEADQREFAQRASYCIGQMASALEKELGSPATVARMGVIEVLGEETIDGFDDTLISPLTRFPKHETQHPHHTGPARAPHSPPPGGHPPALALEADYDRASSDSATLTDTASTGLEYLRSASDSASVSDSASTSLGLAVTASDAASLTDGYTVEGSYNRSIPRPPNELWFAPFIIERAQHRLALHARTLTGEELRVLDTTSGAVLFSTKQASLYPPLFAFAPDGAAFVWFERQETAASDTLHVLDPDTLHERFAVPLPKSRVAAERESPEFGLRLGPRGEFAFVYESSQSWFVSLRSGQARHFQTEGVNRPVFAPDGKHGTWAGPRQLSLWDGSASPPRLLSHPGCNSYSPGLFNDDSTLLAQAAFPFGACLWDVASGRYLTTLAGLTPKHSSAAAPRGASPSNWANGGAVLITSNGNGSYELWDAKQESAIFITGTQNPPGMFDSYATRGPITVVMARDTAGTGLVLARVEGTHVTRTYAVPGCVRFGQTGIFLTDHSAILHCGMDRRLTWVNLESGKISQRALASGWPVRLQLSSDARVLATDSGNFFDADTGALLPRSLNSTLYLGQIHWNGASSLGVTASGPGPSGVHRLQIGFGTKGLTLSDRPDTTRCATAQQSGFVDLGEAILACGFNTEVGPIPIAPAEVQWAQVAPDGSHVLLNLRGKLAVFSRANGALRTLVEGVHFATFAGDRILATTGESLELWDANSARPIKTGTPIRKEDGDLLAASAEFAIYSQTHVDETPGSASPLSLSLEVRRLADGQLAGTRRASLYGPLGNLEFGPNQELAIIDQGIITGVSGEFGAALFQLPSLDLQGSFLADGRLHQALFHTPSGLFETSGAVEAWESTAECRTGSHTLPWRVCTDLLFEPGIGHATLQHGGK